MSQPGDNSEVNRAQRAFNLTLAAVAGQVGCLTLVILILALFVGLWLDTRFATRPLFVILLMIASVPATLVLMFWVVKTATSRLKSDSSQISENLKEGADRGTNS